MRKILLATAVLLFSAQAHAAVVVSTGGAAASAAARSTRQIAERNSSKTASDCIDPYVVICNASNKGHFFNGCLSRGWKSEYTSIFSYFVDSGVPDGEYDLTVVFDSYNKNFVITGCKK